MSWQEYVDNNLVGTKTVSRAAILGKQGGVWAKTAGYNLTDAEQKAVIEAAGRDPSAPASNVTLAGRKFIITRAEERTIQARKQQDGVVIVKTKQSILVAEYDAPIQAGQSTVTVEGLADYLVNAGY